MNSYKFTYHYPESSDETAFITERTEPTARKRYGSCSAKNSLCFSCFLMNCPAPAVELVVVHELCHIREKNHGPRFYALLERYLPDWRERKKLLTMG